MLERGAAGNKEERAAGSLRPASFTCSVTAPHSWDTGTPQPSASFSFSPFPNTPSLPLPLPKQLESPGPQVPIRGVKGCRAPGPFLGPVLYEFSRFGRGGVASRLRSLRRAGAQTASSSLRLCSFLRPQLPIPAYQHCQACPSEPVLGAPIVSSSLSTEPSTVTLLSQREVLRVQRCCGLAT